jgi:hypothetical protein
LHSGHLEELESVFLEVFEQLHEIELVVMSWCDVMWCDMTYVNPFNTLDGNLVAKGVNTFVQQMLRD